MHVKEFTSSSNTNTNDVVSADTSKKLGLVTVDSTHLNTPIDTMGYLMHKKTIIHSIRIPFLDVNFILGIGNFNNYY